MEKSIIPDISPKAIMVIAIALIFVILFTWKKEDAATRNETPPMTSWYCFCPDSSGISGFARAGWMSCNREPKREPKGTQTKPRNGSSTAA